MLQFIAKENIRYSVPELVQMAIEGGCGWVLIDLPEADDAALRDLAAEIVPLCKETSTILTIVDHVELARELGIHGVLLRHSPMSAAEAREFCGPEAIIGVEVKQASDVVPLPALDVDYAAFTPDMPIGLVSENIEAVRSAGIMLPLVAQGAYTISQIRDLLDAHVSGLALSDAIALAPDPVEATTEILRLIRSTEA